MSLISVEDALNQLLATAYPLPSENILLEQAHHRVLAEDLKAKLSQPPFNASAMDGYAMRSEDLAILPVTLTVVGESAAGHRFQGKIEQRQAVRIFTGAPVPDAADTIIIQENTKRDNDSITILEPAEKGANIRPKGYDFMEGETLLDAGKRLNFRDLALAAAMNHATLSVYKRPKVAILATGDELVEPGSTPSPDQIISSIPYGLMPMMEMAGAEVMLLGIAKDTMQSLDEKLKLAAEADVLITIGGASVGDHDLVQKALKNRGMDLQFWKIAMRPGKPVMSGKIGDMHVLGLPGNPVSALVSARVFLLPLLQKLGGQKGSPIEIHSAVLTENIPENGPRQHYMRGMITDRQNGKYYVKPARSQDSSLLKILAQSDCLIIRKPSASKSNVGEPVDILLLEKE